MYPKTYATITRADDASGLLAVRTDSGATLTIAVRQRNGGRTSTASLVPGVRVKLYRRPCDRSLHFRRVGR